MSTNIGLWFRNRKPSEHRWRRCKQIWDEHNSWNDAKISPKIRKHAGMCCEISIFYFAFFSIFLTFLAIRIRKHSPYFLDFSLILSYILRDVILTVWIKHLISFTLSWYLVLQLVSGTTVQLVPHQKIFILPHPNFEIPYLLYSQVFFWVKNAIFGHFRGENPFFSPVFTKILCWQKYLPFPLGIKS